MTTFPEWSEQFTKFLALRIAGGYQGLNEQEKKQVQRDLEELLIEWHRAWVAEVERSTSVVATTRRLSNLVDKLPDQTR